MSKFKSAPVFVLAFLVEGLFGGGPSIAEDRRVQIPGGWEVAPVGVAVCRTGVLVNLEPLGSDAYYTHSQLMFIEKGGGISFTDIPRKVAGIQCDPTGDHVLAHHFGPEGEHFTLVSEPSGEIVWTKSTDEFFQFSPTGKFLYAESAGSGPGCHDSIPRKIRDLNKIKLYNLDGKPRGVITLKKVPHKFFFVDDTTAAVRTTGGFTIYRVSLYRLVRLWDYAFDPKVDPWAGVSLLGRNLILVTEHPPGQPQRTKILALDGKILYDFDNKTALPVGNSASYDLRPWTEGQLLFYNQTPDAFVLDVATGVLKSKRLDIAPPPGFKLRQFAHFTAVFVSDDEVIVRTIAP
jgi:hypothetical protein